MQTVEQRLRAIEGRIAQLQQVVKKNQEALTRLPDLVSSGDFTSEDAAQTEATTQQMNERMLQEISKLTQAKEELVASSETAALVEEEGL